jgi:hypothetical protein
MVMENLLDETIEVLAQHGKSPQDVIWVGSHNAWTTWKNFEAVANTEYDAGFGSQQVAGDLLIVGKNWWLERHEYDGRENWVFNSRPKMPKERIYITALTTEQAEKMGRSVSCGWNDLKRLNMEEEK